ncbi:MAG TPA: hypothetical protein VFT72_05690 [Opitutaceae bacterium]|nr:hypothetical protein [Opitutaceae bacterium]
MNDASKNPRFVCRLARRWTVLFGSSDALDSHGWAGRHIEHCEDCQAYFGAASDFDALLRSEARRSPPARLGLENDIIAAFRQADVREHEVEAPVRTRSRSRVSLAFAGGAMVAAAAAIAFVTVSLHKPAPKNEVAAATPEDVRETLAAARGASQTLWASVKPSADVLVRTDPLNDEINSVVSDARSAVNFLALNFVPDATSTRRLRAHPERSEG